MSPRNSSRLTCKWQLMKMPAWLFTWPRLRSRLHLHTRWNDQADCRGCMWKRLIILCQTYMQGAIGSVLCKDSFCLHCFYPHGVFKIWIAAWFFFEGNSIYESGLMASLEKWVGEAMKVVLVVKNLPANIGDTRDVGLIPGLGRSSGGGRATCSSILAWRIPWTEEPGRLQSPGSQRVGHNWRDLACTRSSEGSSFPRGDHWLEWNRDQVCALQLSSVSLALLSPRLLFCSYG